ncbi:MAG: hypothetical protein WCS83_04440 [Endomicrobiia bacterium]
MNFKFFAVLLVLVLACNTSVLQAKLVNKSSKKMPAWIGMTTEDKSKMYFSGSSTQDTFEKAKKLAVSDALTQIAESLDLVMSVNTTRLITETAVSLEDETSSKSRDVRVLNTKIKDIYFEEHENGGKQSYNVHVLMQYDKKEYQKEKDRLAKEYEGFKQNIANRCTKAKQLIQTNNCQNALPELFEALKIIYTYGVSRTLESEIISNINQLLSYIEIKDSYVSSDRLSGVQAKFNILFSNTKEQCKNFAFIVKTLNNFSIDTVSSNDLGEIQYQFKKVSFLKKSNYKLDLDIKTTYNLDDSFLNAYTFKETSKELNFLGNKRRVLLNISTNKSNSELENLIQSNLVQNGFVVVNKDNDFTVNINVNIVETTKSTIKDVYSSDTALYISNANVTADLLSNDTTQINSVSFEERGFGKTENKSYSDLLQKISTSITNNL